MTIRSDALVVEIIVLTPNYACIRSGLTASTGQVITLPERTPVSCPFYRIGKRAWQLAVASR